MKPYWPPTLQLMPVHLQARDAYVENLVALRTRLVVPHAYGVIEMSHDEEALLQGELVFRQLDAIFPSGLSILLSDDAPLERNVSTMFHETSSSVGVFVGVPKLVPRGINVSPNDGLVRSSRYLASKDNENPWMRAQPEILFERESIDRFEVIALGRIQRVGGTFRFDPEAAPTVVRVRTASSVHRGLVDLVAALERRRDELIQDREDHPLNMEVATPKLELFLALQHHLPMLVDLTESRATHPRDLYRALLKLYAKLRPFGATEAAPRYVHEKPGEIFPWLFVRIAQIVEEAARDDLTVLPFERTDETTLSLSFEREQLVGKQPFLVAFGPDERLLRERAPHILKMASPAAMPPLRGSALSGVDITVEYQPPEGIPRRSGVVTYRIDVRHPLWLDIEDRLQIELFAPFNDPSLRFYVYGVKRLA